MLSELLAPSAPVQRVPIPFFNFRRVSSEQRRLAPSYSPSRSPAVAPLPPDGEGSCLGRRKFEDSRAAAWEPSEEIWRRATAFRPRFSMNGRRGERRELSSVVHGVLKNYHGNSDRRCWVFKKSVSSSRTIRIGRVTFDRNIGVF